MRTMATAATAMAIGLGAAACGDDGGGGQAQTEEGARQAVEQASSAALEGDAGAVLNFLSAECREAVDDDQVRLAVGLVPRFFDDLFEGFGVEDIDVQAQVIRFDGDTARVEVGYVAPDGTDIDTLGFSSETIDVEYEDGRWVDTDCDFEDTTEADAERLEAALADLGYGGTREDPVPPAVAAPVGGGFVVAIDAVDIDAAAAIEEMGGFLAEVEPGTQIVLVSLTVGFDGPDEPQAVTNLNAQLIGGVSGLGVDSYGCGSFPTQLTAKSIELFRGGVTTGDLCFAVPAEDIAGMQLSVEGGFASDRQVIFDPNGAADTPVPVTGTSGPHPEGEYTPDRLAPSPLGTPVVLGDGWTITIRGLQRDATAAVLAASEFNDPPPDGFVYALLEYELAYDGGEQSDAAFSVDVDLVGDSNVSADPNCSVSGVPDEIDRFTDVFQGGTLAGVQCFVIDERDLDSLVAVAGAGFGETRSVLAVG